MQATADTRLCISALINHKGAESPFFIILSVWSNIMSSSINGTILGYIGTDPTSRMVGGDSKVAKFTIAVNRRTGNKTTTTWIAVNCWNGLADVAMTYVRKGDMIQVTYNALSVSAYIDRNGQAAAGIDVTASALQLIGKIVSNASSGDSDAGAPDEGIPF